MGICSSAFNLLALLTVSLISGTSYSHSFPLSDNSYLPALRAGICCPEYLLSVAASFPQVPMFLS